MPIRVSESYYERVMTTVALAKRVRALEEKVGSLTAGNKARAKLRAMILEGLNSGPGTAITPDYWKKKRALIRRKR